MSWDQMLGIIAEAREVDATEAAKLPEDCPRDGTPLLEAGDGILFCPSDGWQYPRDA